MTTRGRRNRRLKVLIRNAEARGRVLEDGDGFAVILRVRPLNPKIREHARALITVVVMKVSTKTSKETRERTTTTTI